MKTKTTSALPKVLRDLYCANAELKKELAELKAEVEKLKAKPATEVHHHYHHEIKWYRDYTITTQPLYNIPPYTFTCGSINQGIGSQNFATSGFIEAQLTQ